MIRRFSRLRSGCGFPAFFVTKTWCLQRLLTVFLFGLVLVSCTAFNSFAQTLDFKRVTVSDGLPHAQIYALLQSDDGYMWIGTGGGLVKYDGVDYMTYTTDDGLKDDLIEVVYEDFDRNIWVSTYSGGVATFRGDSLAYQYEEMLGGLTVSAISQSADGRFWFGTLGGGMFVTEGDSLAQITTEDGLSSDWIWKFWWESEEVVWIATHNGVSIYDGSSFRVLTQENGLSDARVYNIISSPDSRLWLATGNGLTIIDGDQLIPVTEINGVELNFVFDVDVTSDGSVWISTELNGMYLYENGNYRHITKESGLSSNYIYTTYVDRQEHIWIGTFDYGLNLYRGEGFTFLKTQNGLQSDEILGLFKDRQNRYWIGTSRGLSSYDGRTVTNYTIPGSRVGYEQVWYIDQLSNGHIIVVLEDSSILEFDGERFTDYSARYNLEDLYIYDILVDSRGDLWIADNGGVVRVSEDAVRTFTTEDGLSDDLVWHLYEDTGGHIWAGTYNGMSFFDGSGFTSFGVEDGLGHQNVNYITQDAEGDFWIGTGGGITYFRPGSENEPGVFTNIDRNDGLQLLETQLLWFDERGFLWQGTTGGMQRINVNAYSKTKELIVTHFRLLNTGIGVETSHNAILEDERGRGWFGSMNGVIITDPHSLPGPFPTPGVEVRSVALDSQPVNWSDLEPGVSYKNGAVLLPDVEFPYDTRSYTFTYTALEYLHPENVRFRYKLSGFDDEWRPVTTIRSATYTNIGSGDYRFEVQARIGNSPWSESAIYPFSIARPFWETVWFYGLLMLVVLSGIVVITRYRLQVLEKSKLRKLVDEQTREIRNALSEKEILLKEVHHRVKNNLAIISSLLELQMHHMGDGPSKNVLQEGSLRVRSISLIHEKLYQHENISRIRVESYVKSLVESIVSSLKSEKVTVDVRLDLDDIQLTVDDGVPCGLILNELITNAFYHAFDKRDDGTVNIQVKRLNGFVELKVSDNGIGLPAGFVVGKTESLGLILVENLTQQLKGELTHESNGNGTTFTVRFKLRHER